MISTNSLFVQFGGGREGWWDEIAWLAVLGALAAHDGESYTQASNPQLFTDIDSALQAAGITNLSAAGEDESRSVFRAAPAAWVETRVVELDQTIQVTADGHAVLAGGRAYRDCLTRMFGHYRERRNRRNPFLPALALLSDGTGHSFQELFDAIQRVCGPEMVDWIDSSRINGFPYKVEPNPGNPSRSVRFVLRLLQTAGLVTNNNDLWTVDNLEEVHEILKDSAADEESTLPTATVFDSSALIYELSNHGWQFPPWQVGAYCHAVKTKPFVVLAGISGTGKSKLPRLIAEATDATFNIIPVRPDWRDSSDLIGYVDLAGGFHAGPLLRVAKAAMLEPDRQHFVLLDEMNLARVEYYFAEILSLMEERGPDGNGGWRTAPLLSKGVDIKPEDNDVTLPWEEVVLPSNLAIVGSVNMDETTHSFSRKVLDRAFVIEFSEVDLQQVGKATGAIQAVLPLGAEAWAPAALRLAEHPEAISEPVQTAISELIAVNDILRSGQLQVGYRLRDELSLFVLSLWGDPSLVDRAGAFVDPIDLALCMKILPRIQGGGLRTRELLIRLAEWSGPVDQPRLPMCAERVALLLERFDAEGFTSFWL